MSTESDNVVGKINTIVDSMGNLPDSVKSHVLDQTHIFLAKVDSLISRCESPIEQILCIHLIKAEINLSVKTGYGNNMEAQVEVEIEGKKYRTDFCLTATVAASNLLYDDDVVPQYVLYIECDGHDFHERTKEQAAKDRAKDRAFMRAGLPLIRFTGSEIVSDPFKCAAEALETFQSITSRN